MKFGLNGSDEMTANAAKAGFDYMKKYSTI